MPWSQIDADNKGVIEEEEFYSYMLQQLKEKDSLIHVRSLPFQDPPKFKHNMHSKETLCRMVANGNASRYITVSKVCAKDITILWNLVHDFTLFKGGKHSTKFMLAMNFINSKLQATAVFCKGISFITYM